MLRERQEGKRNMYSSAASVRGRRTIPRLFAFIAITAGIWNSAGCDTGINSQEVRLGVAIDRTGTLRSDGAWIGMTDNQVVTPGDTGSLGGDGSTSNLELRGFISVTHGALPAVATIDKVVLHLHSRAIFGNPFFEFGTLYVDHVNIVANITKDRFNEVPLSAGFATIPEPVMPDAMEDVVIDVTDQVVADIAAGRPISSFRVRFGFAPSADLQHDVLFFDANPDDATMQPYATATVRN